MKKTPFVEKVEPRPQGLSLDDCLLRKRGFRIHTRLDGLEPRWIRDGRVYPESQAVELAKAEVRREKGK